MNEVKMQPKQVLTGSMYPRGNDGISPTFSVEDIEGGHRVTIADKQGVHYIDIKDGIDGEKGDPGKDYVLTDEDKEEIAKLNADAIAEAKLQVVTTAGTGSSYTAEVPGITELTPGVCFVMIPHTNSLSRNVSVNVNNLGSRRLRRVLSSGNDADGVNTANPYDTAWLREGFPVLVVYTGGFWNVLNFPKPKADDLDGIVPVASGGTGLETLTSGSYLVGNGNNAVTLKTPEEVRSHIGAASEEELWSIYPATLELNADTMNIDDWYYTDILEYIAAGSVVRLYDGEKYYPYVGVDEAGLIIFAMCNGTEFTGYKIGSMYDQELDEEIAHAQPYVADLSSGGAFGEADEQISMLIEADMLPAVHDASGAILTDENGNVILRY